MTWWTVMEYMCHKWPWICSTCRKHFLSFPHSWLITGFVTGRTDNTRRKSAKGQTMIHKTLHRKLKIEQHEPH
jgi:hypothetical protein